MVGRRRDPDDEGRPVEGTAELPVGHCQEAIRVADHVFGRADGPPVAQRPLGKLAARPRGDPQPPIEIPYRRIPANALATQPMLRASTFS
ncbi:hypothetical protein KSP39_PZI017021 [Platanthera zijinensis]|uniref:Uncharacterized protein n=1 Tax=Platanthera zijinensis TaxID=2320716 RepID=A0AAP0B7I7_9ASPA